MRGHGGECGKAAVVHLLLAAGGVELHDFHECWVGEVGDGRIVKSEVPIFPNAEAANINRCLAEQCRIARALGGGVCAFTSDPVEGVRGDL